jgi:hypothetical protein
VALLASAWTAAIDLHQHHSREGRLMSDDPSNADANIATEMADAEVIAAANQAGVVGAPGPAGPNVPATASSVISGEGNVTFLNVGTTSVRFPVDRNRLVYWFVAVDMTTQLNVVANATSDNPSTVPPEIKRLQNDPRYFFFVIGNALRGHMIPTGELYAFLKAIGSGRQLASLEQIAAQVGTGTIFRFAYVLAATATEGDLPGFEAFSDNHHVFLTMQFMPIRLNDKIVYAPCQHF